MKIIIDFDSTIIQKEALDVLAELVLKDNIHGEEIKKSIHEITEKAMNGEMQFDEALEARISLLSISQSEIENLIMDLKLLISKSFLANTEFLKSQCENIYVISGGFKEYIIPVIQTLGLKSEHVFANTFIFENSQVIGFDKSNFLAQPLGKVKVLQSLNFQDEVVVIGDGFTDYEIFKHGLATKFYLYVEHVYRKNIAPLATNTITTLDEFIQILNK